MLTSFKKQSGFTIVELLIVIVVIGILAAITIVAYNGIQDRADRTQTTSAVIGYVKGLAMYATDNNSYPITSGCIGGTNNISGKCVDVSGGGAVCFGLSNGVNNSAFDTTMKQYLNNNLPAPSPKSYNCASNQYGGVWYWGGSAQVAHLYAFFRASGGPCPSLSGVTFGSYTQDDTLLCRYDLPTLP